MEIELISYSTNIWIMKKYMVSYLQPMNVRLRYVVIEAESPKDALHKAVMEELPTKFIYDDWYEAEDIPYNYGVEGEILPDGTRIDYDITIHEDN